MKSWIGLEALRHRCRLGTDLRRLLQPRTYLASGIKTAPAELDKDHAVGEELLEIAVNPTETTYMFELRSAAC